MNAMRATDVIRYLLDERMPVCPPDDRGWAVPPDDLRRLCDLADAVQAMAGRHSGYELDVLIENALTAWRAFDAEYLGAVDHDAEDSESTNPRMPSSPDLLSTARG